MAISFVGSLPTVAAANGGNVTLTFSNLRDAAGVQPTLAQNDVVFAVFAWGNTADYVAPTISGWTLLDDKYANGSTNDTNLAVYYKRMGAVPDTAVTANGPGGSANSSIGVAFALRGVDTTTAIDAYTSGSHSTTGTGTGAINPVAITPSTAGAWIAVAGALANPIGNTLTNGGDLSATTNHYRTGTSPDTTDISIGVGLKTDWASGAFDPAAWSGGGTRAAGDSWAAMTWAIKPAPGVQTLTPTLLTDSQTFHAPAVAASNTLTASLVGNTQTFHGPTATASYTLVSSLFTNSQTLHAPTVVEVQILAPGVFGNAQTFFTPTVAAPYTLSAPLVVSGTTIHAPAVTSTATMLPSLLTGSQTFYGATVSQPGGGTQVLSVGLLLNETLFFAPSVQLFSFNMFTRVVSFRRVKSRRR